ncbi:MAG: Na/Pi symporter, partial [Rubrivivax sp.]|nr:Na/Pi symporter [Rubrivivax sp.]
MVELSTAAQGVGGLGLFLLGMGLMTDGLKLVAGPALHQILVGATRTQAHAMASGALVTALVQSSSAVTVATIGFVNAGLLALGPALWVLFGANVGTTMTGWIVALVGLKLDVEALAMPLVGLGALTRLMGEGRRSGAIGTALAGFGLLFMGIGLLQQAFAGLAGQVSFPQGEGPLMVLAQLGIGLLMTVLMQSSSAAMAITLTAAQGGLIDLQGAAAVVIGANIGTTVTALLAIIGATPNARRAALAHVVFNVMTGAVALLLLPWIVGALVRASVVIGLPAGTATTLALFHTTFNLLGVLLMWPLAPRFTHWLQQRFRAREDDEAQPQHLDNTVLAVPTLALDALAREVARARLVTVRMVRAAIAGADARALEADSTVFSSLDGAIDRFVERLREATMSPRTSSRLADL